MTGLDYYCIGLFFGLGLISSAVVAFLIIVIIGSIGGKK